MWIRSRAFARAAAIAAGMACAAALLPASATRATTDAPAPADDGAPRTGGIEQALRGDSTLLLVLVFEGMRGDALDRTRRGGDPLMPRLRALASRSLVFADCLTGAAVPDAGAFELLAGRPGIELLAHGERDGPVTTGLSALVDRGFRPVSIVVPPSLRGDRTLAAAFPWAFGPAGLGPAVPAPAAQTSTPGVAVLDSVLASCARQQAPQLVLFFADVLVPPYRLDDRILEAIDPTPWSGMREVRDLQRNRSERNRAARAAAEGLADAGGAHGAAEGPALAWAVDAAHAQADAVVGHVVDRLEDKGLASRTVLVVTSTLGTATGDSGDAGTGHGVSREDVHGPLLVSAVGQVGDRIEAPVQLMDLATTLAHLAGGSSMAPDEADLLTPGGGDRVRWSYGWWHRTEGMRTGFQGEARMTTTRLAFLATADGDARLYDLDPDGREAVDVARWETGLVQASAARLAAHLFGRAPQIWILVKAEPGRHESDGELVGGRLRVRPAVEAIVPDGLEAMDVLELSAPSTVTWSFLADDGGDVARIQLSGGAPALALQIEAPGAARRWPLFVGEHAWPVEDAPGALSPYAEPLLRAIVRSPDTDIVAWGVGRPAGVYLWIVPSPES